jgi:hypothetical protein
MLPGKIFVAHQLPKCPTLLIGSFNLVLLGSGTYPKVSSDFIHGLLLPDAVRIELLTVGLLLQLCESLIKPLDSLEKAFRLLLGRNSGVGFLRVPCD